MSSMPLDIKQVNQMTTGSIPLARHTGAELIELERGRVKMRIPFEGNQNHINIMYAGSLFTIAELPGGSLFFSAFDVTKCYPIVTEMSIKFLKPAKTAVTVEATLSDEEIERVKREVEEKGKSVYILNLELKDESGEVVATTSARYQARAHGR
ncbi:MAG: PaaI family thioesterase [Pseudomonadota bacterium]